MDREGLGGNTEKVTVNKPVDEGCDDDDRPDRKKKEEIKLSQPGRGRAKCLAYF